MLCKAEQLGHRAGTDHDSVISYGKEPEVFGLACARRAYSWDMRQTRQPGNLQSSLCRYRTERTPIERWKDKDKKKCDFAIFKN
jgi:hypothetical protein